jgi:hypothetical protein
MKLIGICGFATAGKDFAADQIRKILIERGNTVAVLSLAYSLKKSLRPLLQTHFGVDIMDCTPQDKTLVRPMLVEYGRIRRTQSQGTYYTNILENLSEFQSSDYVIVPDIRYHQYEETDEYAWVRKHGGRLLCVSRDGVLAPNNDEAINVPLLKKLSDLVIHPPYFQTDDMQNCDLYFRGVLEHLERYS